MGSPVYKASFLTYNINIGNGVIPINWPSDRNAITGNNVEWDEEDEVWTPDLEFINAGSGKLKIQLVVVADGKVYFEDY